MKTYSMDEAREVLNRFRGGFPNIAAWMDHQKMRPVPGVGFIHERTALDLELNAFDQLRQPAPIDLTFMERVFKAVDEETTR